MNIDALQRRNYISEFLSQYNTYALVSRLNQVYIFKEFYHQVEGNGAYFKDHEAIKIIMKLVQKEWSQTTSKDLQDYQRQYYVQYFLGKFTFYILYISLFIHCFIYLKFPFM